ncbi:MAG: type II toxin-antitoxin system VapC family toxin, partial [Arcobacter sp.]|nr:type II toxin-antitoxin system VapC family toxin [Arcobacter sp.]
MKYFLDTNICIYFLKGISKNLQNKFSRINPNDIKIPSMIKAELLYGVKKSLRKKENAK